MPYDVIIIGGGIAGCAVARELSRYRLRLALLEKKIEVGFGTSKANSGIIHGGHHADAGTLKGRLEWEGNQLWDALCADLGFGFHRCGELTVAFAAEQTPFLDDLLRNAAARGVPGLELWDRARLAAEEPNLSREAVAAVYAPTTGVVNPYEACFNLASSACRNGLELNTECAVTGLDAQDGRWTVHTARGDFYTRFVINAAGLYADRIADMAGARTFTLHPRKGEEYLLDKRVQGLVQRVIFPCPTPVSKGILVIPTFDGTLMVGPTAQPVDDKEDLTTTAAGAEKVFAAVQRMVPGISARDCIAEFAGLRVAAAGEDFIIGPTAAAGFINVAGIQSPGLTAAPAIARRVAEILRDEGLALREKDDFVAQLPPPVRFAVLSTEEQMAVAASNPRFARIACRCELVTEGEVVEAIRQGARTLDGIKFRTRAGMGRCQGGFCAARCMELIARERSLPLTAITKRGGNTWLLLNRAQDAAGSQEPPLPAEVMP